MKTAVRKIGNSAGVIIAANALKVAGIKLGDEVEIQESPGCIKITAARPKYTLDELLAQCDENASVPRDLEEWDMSQPVGNELL